MYNYAILHSSRFLAVIQDMIQVLGRLVAECAVAGRVLLP